jgi:hypothetical protein
MNYWVETVLAPQVRRDGEVLEPFTPFELRAPMRLGPEGSGATFEWAEHELELRPEAEGVRAKWVRLVGEDRLVKVGGVGQIGPLMFRVMSSPQESAGWPARLARPPAPWTVETRTVLADQFLELGLNVGRRFIGRSASEDQFWFPIGGRWPEVRWFLGTTDRVKLSGSPTSQYAHSLVRQAVCAPMKQLELSFREPPDHAAVVTGLIAAGGLPCLEQLRLKVEPTDEVKAVNAPLEVVEKLRALPGFGAAFPALQSMEVEDEIRSPRPYQPVG